MRSPNDDARGRSPITEPEIPVDRSALQAHFERAHAILRAHFVDVPALNPTSKGSVKEEAVSGFLAEHIPGPVSVGPGHVLFSGSPSSQQDIIVYERRGLVLPIGSIRLVAHDAVIACVEVKSTLYKKDLLGDISRSIGRFPNPRPLMIVVAGRLEGGNLYRGIIRKWIGDENVPADLLPDIITILDVGTVIRRGRLLSLSRLEKELPMRGPLLKYGDFKDERWSGLAIAVFEIAARTQNVDWGEHLHQLIPKSLSELEA